MLSQSRSKPRHGPKFPVERTDGVLYKTRLHQVAASVATTTVLALGALTKLVTLTLTLTLTLILTLILTLTLTLTLTLPDP